MAKKNKKPGRKRGSTDAFKGRSGQLAVMAELLQRGCNAAIPEVDLGTDLFAFTDDREEVARIQVKTNSNPTVYKDGSGYSAKFAIPIKQLERPGDRPALHYALAVRLNGKWVDFLVIGRGKLRELWDGTQPFGSENLTTGDLEITVAFRHRAVTCSGQDLTPYRNAWEQLPPLHPKLDVRESGTASAQAASVPAVSGGSTAPAPPPSETPRS